MKAKEIAEMFAAERKSDFYAKNVVDLADAYLELLAKYQVLEKAARNMKYVYEKLKELNDRRDLTARQIFGHLQAEYDVHGEMFILLKQLTPDGARNE